MFGLDTIKVAIVAGLILSSSAAAYAVYHGIQAAELHKIELQQAKLIAAAQHEQDQRSIDALQQSADLAAALAAQENQLKDALHAAPVSRSCLATPAGLAFTRWLHNGAGPGAAGKAAATPVAVPTATAAGRR